MAIGLAGQRIITKGLGVGSKACASLITTHFSVYCRDITPPPPPPSEGGGWSYPSAWDIYKPLDKDILDPEKMLLDKKEVTIKAKFGTFHMEKIYIVPKAHADIIVKAIKLTNTTRSRIAINVNKVRRVLHNITVTVSKLRRK